LEVVHAECVERAHSDLRKIDLAGADVGDRSSIAFDVFRTPPLLELEPDRAARKTTHRGNVFGQVAIGRIVRRNAEDDGFLLALPACLRSAAAADCDKSKRRKKEPGEPHGQDLTARSEAPQRGSTATFASRHGPCGTMNG
jgi:hypothetical protein